MSRNQRKRAQEALFSPAPSTTPPDAEKAAERMESTLTAIPAAPSPADIICDEYGIAANCTNVPQILRAILCEMVRRRV